MSEARFDILFGGEVLPGFAPATVAENLGKLFKATPETVSRLMGGGTHALKRGADRETALKYQAAMHKAGAKAILREAADESAAAAPAPAAAAPVPAAPAAAPAPKMSLAERLAREQAAAAAAPAAPAPAAAAAPAAAPAPAPAATPGSLALAPQAGELLAPHERPVVEAVVVDTAHIKLVSAFGSAPEAERTPPPPAPDTAHLSMAAVGSDLLPDRAPDAAPPPPDTSAITLAAPGATLGVEAVPLPLELPDISAITLAPPGAPLEELRPERTPVNPDISALALAPQPR